MFRKSKRKIVAAIMSVLMLLFIGTLAIIYTSSYAEVSASNNEMLARYAELFSLERQPSEEPPLDSAEKVSDDAIDRIVDSTFRLSTFYSVALSDDGDVLAMDNDEGSAYEDALLQQYAQEIIASGKNRGEFKNLLYTTANKDGYTLVAFMDNTIIQQSMTTLFRNTIKFGGLMMVVLFVLAMYLAGKIVKPLEENHKKQKQFISDAGHELKTPVAVISANADLLARDLGTDNPWLANICYENEKMGHLVAQLLLLAKSDDGQMQKTKLDLSRLVQGEALPFESVAFEKGLMLNCDIQEAVFVEASSIQLKQLLSILLDNALSHAQGGPEVFLVLKSERHDAILSVINDGEEIPDDQRERLFERFYRVDAARNGADGHYGLGLSIAKAIVTAHKGQIRVLCHDGKVECVVRLPLAK